MDKIQEYIDNIQQWIEDFFAEHCLVFWHDYQPVKDEQERVRLLQTLPSSERWHNEPEQCTKCGNTRLVLQMGRNE